MCSVCAALSLVDALCAARSEFDSSRQLSDDAGVAHQLCEHMAVPHDIRMKQSPLWWRRVTIATAASLPG